ncbi:MAG: prephenate dehydratase [Pirellulales bacterium]|nr:prephenate dehydratase [Pirellulales bacterium]
MAREPSARAAKRAVGPNASIAGLRQQLERLDRELIRLINQRAQAAAAFFRALANAPGDGGLAEAHAAAGIDEQSILRLLEHNKGPLSNDCMRGLFVEMSSVARTLVKTMKVAYLGPAYSYSHLAALHRFGSSVEYVPVGSISAVFEEVNRGQVEFGLVPVHNSTDGRIADTLDMFTRLRVRICGEVQLRIRHALLARCPRAEVREVYSRPQALSQCRNWLSKHLPAVRLVEVISTSDAARLALDKPGSAAIASVQAARHYGLDVLAEDIEDQPGNITRFVVIGGHPAERTGKDMTAVMFEVEHRPGTLADAMVLFKKARLNLTWIESFPIPRPEGGYLFFIEFDGHESDSRVRKALAGLKRRTVRMEVLGSYPRSEPVG